MHKIVKSTSKGQITLPKAWRNQFNTDNFIVKTEGIKLEIIPLNIDELEEELELENEEIIFDAKRDNKGKGIPPEKVIRMIDELNNG